MFHIRSHTARSPFFVDKQHLQAERAPNRDRGGGLGGGGFGSAQVRGHLGKPSTIIIPANLSRTSEQTHR